MCVRACIQETDRKEVEVIQCSSITGACSHIEGVGPSLRIGSLSGGSTAVGFGGCCLYGLRKSSCANKHTHRND